ncbi:MAG: terminase large subunit domain-containing protein [Salinibacter sp.]
MLWWWREDVAQWINDCVFTYDPRNLGRGLPTHVPFDLFPKQIEYVRWLEDRFQGQENGLLEKSRDMGATWLNCAFAAHHWIFVPGFSAGFGSRKEGLVDRIGDLDAIFPKIRYIFNSLPSWMMPEEFNKHTHDNYLRILNPETGATIKGEGGDEVGRGGRSSMYFIDEHAKLQHAEMVDAAVSNNSDCVIYVSTPSGGMRTLFANKRHSGEYNVFTLHWKDDPRKDEQWYESMRRKYDPVTIAQEVDIDYTASVEGVVIPGEWVKAAIDLELPEKGIKEVGFDVAAEGGNENVAACHHGSRVLPLQVWTEGNTTQSAYRIKALVEQWDGGALKYDLDGPGVGIQGPLESVDESLAFDLRGIRSGGQPTEICYSDAPDLPASERFANFRAEMWWNLRLRFHRTWEHVKGIAEYPLDELISIPNDQTLITQLSLLTMEWTDKGKIKVESKRDLRKRNVASPDRADALVYAFAPRHGRKGRSAVDFYSKALGWS